MNIEVGGRRERGGVIMIIIEICNILLLLLSKPTNSFLLYFSSPSGNEKWETLAQFNMIPILLSYHIGYIIMICV